MQELFGIPIDTLLVVLVVLLAMVAGALGLLALRNRVLLKLGVRNVGRRRARSGLAATLDRRRPQDGVARIDRPSARRGQARLPIGPKLEGPIRRRSRTSAHQSWRGRSSLRRRTRTARDGHARD